MVQKGEHDRLYETIMQSAAKGGTAVIETEEEFPDLELDLETPGKAERNALLRTMPEGIFDDIEVPDEAADADEFDVDDIDISNVSITDMVFGEEATETWLDTIADHANHEYYSRTEIRDILNQLPDEYYIQLGSYLIELGEQAGPVTGFRRKR